MYPNPAHGFTNLLVHEDFEGGLAQVFDGLGRLLMERKLEAGTTVYRLGLEALPSGTYTILVRSEQGISALQLVVE